MNINETEARIEAILFTMGEAVETERLAIALGHDVDTVRRLARNMMDKYDVSDRGIKMIEINDSFQLCTKPEMYDSLVKVAHVPKKHVLSDSLLETLSIVAYKQPVIRAEIDNIRGVSSEHAINKLIEYKLICELGRLNAPGRPILFGTTENFLRCFGLTSLSDLPVVKPEKIEDFKIEIEDELQLKLDI